MWLDDGCAGLARPPVLLCIPFLSCLYCFPNLNVPLLQATKPDVSTACIKGILLLSLLAGDFLT